MQEETKQVLNAMEEDKFKATPLILTTTKLRKQIKDTKKFFSELKY